MTSKMSMNNIYEYNFFGTEAVAFTTRRTLGRDRKRLCQMLNIDDAHLIIPHQVHSDKVLCVDESIISMSAEQRKAALEGVDAVVTSLRGVCIGVSTADCIPILLYDPTAESAAAIHAGWRGTVSSISRKSIEMMKRKYGSKPADIKAVIGPGISLKNFEVGDEVYEKFAAAGFDMPSIAKKYEKWHIDLWECNRQILLNCGVKAENIHVERVCTYDNTDSLFSARAEQTGIEKCGRNFNAIMIK
jgi:YfiH family protein